MRHRVLKQSMIGGDNGYLTTSSNTKTKHERCEMQSHAHAHARKRGTIGIGRKRSQEGVEGREGKVLAEKFSESQFNHGPSSL